MAGQSAAEEYDPDNDQHIVADRDGTKRALSNNGGYNSVSSPHILSIGYDRSLMHARSQVLRQGRLIVDEAFTHKTLSSQNRPLARDGFRRVRADGTKQ